VKTCQARLRDIQSAALAAESLTKPAVPRAGGRACGSTIRRLRSLPRRSKRVARMHAALNLLLLLIRIYIWLLIAQAILSWLLAFGVINRYNRGVSVIGDFLYRITEPALRPIRAILPNFGGIDISPVILILILYFISDLIIEDLAPYLL
jgi:YggT family protein